MTPSVPTSLLLEQMADGARFERLAVASLRHLEPLECGTLVQLGVNAEGKPVASSLDGFTCVPWSQPPLFIAVACTTEKRLREKWLGLAKNPRHSACGKAARARDENADLPKAIKEISHLRSRFPEARFKIFLTTNRGVDDDLQADVAALLQPDQIAFEIVDRGRLSDFLDQSGAGHFLRESFLGVPAVVLSRDLLYECGRRQLADRAQCADLQGVGTLVSREIEDDLRIACGNPLVSLVWLVGDPGKGKSLAACGVMRRHLECEGLVQWFGEEQVRQSVTMEEAMLRAVARVKPAIRCNDSNDLVGFSSPSDRMVVLVDDLNRSDDPQRDFGKVRTWAARMVAGEGGGGESSVVLICPIWRRHRRRLERAETSGPHWELEIEVPDFTEPEFNALAQANRLSPRQRSAVHAVAGRDPFLSSRFITAQNAGTASSRELPRLDASGLLVRQLDEIEARTPGFSSGELAQAMESLACWMLEARVLNPDWSAVVRHFHDTYLLEALRALIKEGRLVHVMGDRLLFTHDRLQDMWLARALPRALAAPGVAEEVYFAEIIGQAICDGALDTTQLDLVARANPLSLFSAWQLISGNPDHAMRGRVIERIRSWLGFRSGPYDDTDRMMWEIARKLDKSTGPEVIEIGEQLRENRAMLVAMLRNGSAKAGVRFIRPLLGLHFPPAIDDPWWDSAVLEAKAGHEARLVAGVMEMLGSSGVSSGMKVSSILLLGYMRAPVSTGCFEKLWAAVMPDQQQEWLAAMLWTTARCLGAGASEIWEKLLCVWATLPQDESASGYSKRNAINFVLGQCRGPWMPDELALWIEARIRENHELKPELSRLLCSTDAPSALDYTVRKRADHQRAKGKSLGSNLELLSLGWRDRRERPFSPASRERLRSIWSAEARSNEEREVALRYWALGAKANDLSSLRILPPESPLAQVALPVRMRLGDSSCVAQVARLLPENRWWLPMVPAIWNRQLLKTVSMMLADFDSSPRSTWSDHAYEFFILLPPSDAEILIWRHREKFQEASEILQAAVLVGTPVLRKWVATLLDRRPELAKEVFQYVAMRINMGRSYTPPWHSKRRFLQNLEPFIDRIPQEELRKTVEEPFCLESEWCRRHILPRLSDTERKAQEMSEVALATEFARYTNGDLTSWHAEKVFEAANRRGWGDREAIDLLVKRALVANSPLECQQAAVAIGARGNRNDLQALGALHAAHTPEWCLLRREVELQVRRRTL